MDGSMICTSHAVHRQAQRNLSDRDVQFVIEHGRSVRRAGMLHVFLGRRDIPGDKDIQRRFGRLEGTILIVSEGDDDDLVLVTVYRNRRGYKRIRSKSKYDRHAA